MEQLEGLEFSPPNPLGPDELTMYRDVKYRLPPSNINPYVAYASWALERTTLICPMSCDSCSKTIFDVNYTCLTCIDPEMTNTFDFCPQCIDKPAEREGVIHTVDHTLIKCSRFTLPYALAWQIQEARSMSKRLKKILTEASTSSNKDNQIDVEEQSKKRPELLCSYCTKPVTVPCWACVTCVPDFWICDNCHRKGASVLENVPENVSHRVYHPLLRLHNRLTDKFEQEKVDPIAARIDDLEISVGKRLAELDTRLANLENVIEVKLSSFESLLTKAVLKLNVPPEE